MSTITQTASQPTDPENPDGVFGAEFKPLTAEEAQQWRSNNPAASPWRVVAWQLVAGVLLALAAGALGGMAMAMSAGYGALAVVLPAAVLARGMGRQRGATQAGAVLMGFVVWESAKVALTVAMLVLAPRLVVSLSWLALVVGFVVTMKVYWVAAWLHSKRPNRNV